VRFNEITKKAVLAAMEGAGDIDGRLVDAQQARRIIDRLVGYEVSDLPLEEDLARASPRAASRPWRCASSASARTRSRRSSRSSTGRSTRSWKARPSNRLHGALSTFDGEKLKFDGNDPRLADEAGRARVREDVEKAAWTVSSVETSERRKNPAPPFITSQLQQAAARRYGFAVRRTMQIAQRLYEGREIPGARHGRPDHLHAHGLDARLRGRAALGPRPHRREVREGVAARDGALLQEPARHPGRARGDPPDVPRPSAEEVAKHVAADEAKLYRLIWERFVASQMTPAVYDTTSAEITAGRAVYRASGSTLKSAGYLAAYGVSAEEEEDSDKDSPKLPPLAVGEPLKLVKLSPEKKETQPPPRFNEASLVKFLEENGIGRPSTYAEILRKIEERRYVHKKDRRFIPTALGRTVIELLIPYFDDFFETSYTARMEEALDEVEEGKLSWIKALSEFDKTFTKDRDRALEDMHSSKAGIPLAQARKLKLSVVPAMDEKCPNCGKKLKIRMGKNGLFVACSGYPTCTFTQDIPDPEEDAVDMTELENRTCDECGEPMKVRQSRTGSTFLGCTAFPKCRNVVNIAGRGREAEARRTSRRGRSAPLRAPAREAVRPLRRVRLLLELPGVQVQAAEADPGHGCAVPEGRGIIAERRGTVPSVLRLRELPEVRLLSVGAPDPEPCPQCGNPYLLHRERKFRQRLRVRQGGLRLREAGGSDPAARRGHPGGEGRAGGGGGGPQEAARATRGGEQVLGLRSLVSGLCSLKTTRDPKPETRDLAQFSPPGTFKNLRNGSFHGNACA
jgi:DNA topoisomerase-1